MEAAGVAADVNAYNALMTLYARAGLWEEAWAVLTTMRQAGIVPNTRSYNACAPAPEASGIYAILMAQLRNLPANCCSWRWKVLFCAFSPM